MFKFTVQRDQQQSTLLTLAADQNIVIVKATRIQSTHLQQAQTKLLIQFTIHQNHEDSASWTALEHSLKQSFDNIVACDMLPGCILKMHVFILNAQTKIESAIGNAVWTCLLLHGVPMHKSIFHYEWNSKGQHTCRCLLDVNMPSNILFAQANEPVPASAVSECQVFKTAVVEFVKGEWNH